MARRDARIERMLALLRREGGRVTAARRAVLGALVAGREHLTAEALAEAVQAEHPDVHLSTVYRALDAFEKLGVVTHVHLGHGRAVYHLTDERHHHAVCEGCGAVAELPEALLDDVRVHLAHHLGFEVDAFHFALQGRCRRCAGAPHAGPAPVGQAGMASTPPR